MEQLWYTSCRNGLASGGGNQVRAASRGLKDLRSERNQRLSRYLRYSLPPGAQPHVATSATAPRSLALLETGQERILLHQAYVGLDYTGMRYGNHFSHLLVDVPYTLTAARAIELWGSDFWQTTEPESMAGQYDLPLVEPADLKRGPLTFARLDGQLPLYLEWLLIAYLTPPKDTRIVIIGPEETVAAMIWGLTHTLPEQLTAALTFVTYTDDLAASAARIAATTAQGDEQARAELPRPAKEPFPRGLNLFTGRGWQPAETDPFAQRIREYAAWATRRLGSPELQQLLDLAAERPAWSLDHFLNAFAVFASAFRDAGPTPAALQQILAEPEYAARLLTRPAVQAALIPACASADARSEAAQWWAQTGKLAFGQLARGPQLTPTLPDALDALGATAAAMCARLVEGGDVTGAERVFRDLLTPLAGDDARAAWDPVLRQVRPERARDVEARAWVLTTSAGVRTIRNADALDAAIAPWLRVARDALKPILVDTRLPVAWRTAALQDFLAREPLPATELAGLADIAGAMLGDALANLAADPATQPLALRYFAQLVETNSPGKAPILRRLLRNIPAGPDAAPARRALVGSMPLLPGEIIQLANDEPALVDDPDLARHFVDQYLDHSAGDWLRWLDLLASPALAAELLGRVDERNRIVDGIFDAKDAFMRAGHHHLPTLERREPPQLRIAVANLVETCHARVAYALEERRFDAAAFVFDKLIAPLAERRGDALAAFIAIAQRAVDGDDSDAAWQLRDQILLWLIEARAGVRPDDAFGVDRLAEPFLKVTPRGLIRLAAQLFGRSRPVRGETIAPEFAFLDEWLATAERGLREETPQRTYARPDASSAPERPFALSDRERARVAQQADRYRARLREAAQARYRPAVEAYFTALIQSDPAQTFALLEEVLPLWKEAATIDRLVTIALKDIGEVSGTDDTMRLFESLMSREAGADLLAALALSPTFTEMAAWYLRRVTVDTCDSEAVRATLRKLATAGSAQPTGDVAPLADLWTEVARLADLWTEVAQLKGGNTDSLNGIIVRLKDIMGTQSGAAALAPLVDLLLRVAREPKQLSTVLQNEAVRGLAARSGQRPSTLTTFQFALSSVEAAPVGELALRLAPYVALAVGYDENYGSQYEQAGIEQTIKRYLLAADPALVAELDRLLRDVLQKRPIPEQNWKAIKAKVSEQRGGVPAFKKVSGALAGLVGGDRRGQPAPRGGSKRARRTFLLHRVTEEAKTFKEMLDLWKDFAPREGLRIFDLAGVSLSHPQIGDLVAVQIDGFKNDPGAPDEDAVAEFMNQQHGRTGKWVAHELPGSMLSFLSRLVYFGPSYAHLNRNHAVLRDDSAAPWAPGDILLLSVDEL